MRQLTLLFALLVTTPALAAPQLKILLPLGRTAYQTNEQIDLTVVRTGSEALPAGDLKLTVSGEDGSRLSFTFSQARAVEHLRLNVCLLRPGRYVIEAMAGGAVAQVPIEVCSHVRKSTFKLIDWGCRAKGAEQGALGEDGLGFNLLYAAYGGLSADDAIRGGLDYMWCCTMGGGHQMDLRQECDWSDPYVVNGGTARVAQRAFKDRTNPNCIGVHFYDEPGLTWWKHPATGEEVPHNVPSQDRAFQATFGVPPLQYNEVKPDDPRWMQWGRWKESFMDAAWKNAAFGVSWVRPDYLSATQSIYGWHAFSDGYYFNVVRSLPVVSGHGGYDDGLGTYLFPSFTFEFGRARDLSKPTWYLPSWWGDLPADRFRLEQYLSFMDNLQGMAKPPDQTVHRPSTSPTAGGIVESNKVMARLGTIFTTMPVTRPDAAILYSLSNNLDIQTREMMLPRDQAADANYGHYQMVRLISAYLASKSIHTPLFPIVEEDVLDGTLAANHKAVVLAGINYLDPKVVAGLEAFAASGGAVLLTDDCKVQIKGASKVGCAVDATIYDKISQAWNDGNQAESLRLRSAGMLMKAAAPLAKALGAALLKAGVRPVMECDNPSIIVSRQAYGDVEYFFAANASYDEGVGGTCSLKPATAKLTLPAGGQLYDAIAGGPITLPAGGAAFRFGPGQMRVFARTAQPIEGVSVRAVLPAADYTGSQPPLRVEVQAAVLGEGGGAPRGILAGSIPLQIRVIDPLGAVRYDLYRATDEGVCKLSLPLAANDPAGPWKVEVRELLANTAGTTTFAYRPPAQCGALAGAVPRALFFGRDRENAFRFLKLHQDVTVVKGTGDYEAAAADRLVETLKPWGVRCRVVAAADVNKPRALTADEAKTWVGLEFGRAAAGDKNSPAKAGFALDGPAILLGTPEDNPLIKFTADNGFLPYKPDKADLPGPGRGMLAWQRDAIGLGQESLTLIAYDAAGMSEAVGTLYEAAAGLEPVTSLTLPAAAAVAPAGPPRAGGQGGGPAAAPEPAAAWELRLPDRAVGIRALADGRVVVLTDDGSLSMLDGKGKLLWQKPVDGGETWAFDAAPDGRLIAVGASQHLVCFDGKGKELCDVPTIGEKPLPVITFVAVSPDGDRVAAGTDDGKVTAYTPAGKRLWTAGGIPRADLEKYQVDVKTWEQAVRNWEAAVRVWDAQVKEWEKAPEAARGKKPDKPAKPNPPTKPKPDPYLAGIFSANGGTLVALTAKEAHVIDAAKGSIGARVGGVSGKVAPARLGVNLLLSDGGEKAILFSPAEGKALAQMGFAKESVCCLAPAGEGVLVGTECDGVVRSLKALEGKLEEQAQWQVKQPYRLTKYVAPGNGQVAVAYWGGSLQILDAATGAVKSAVALPQDVTGLAWSGGTLVVVTADGKAMGLK